MDVNINEFLFYMDSFISSCLSVNIIMTSVRFVFFPPELPGHKNTIFTISPGPLKHKACDCIHSRFMDMQHENGLEFVCVSKKHVQIGLILYFYVVL